MDILTMHWLNLNGRLLYQIESLLPTAVFWPRLRMRLSL